MKELLAQLRELATGGDCRYMDTCNEAADALERLTAENAQLIGEMADQGPCINNLRDKIVGLTAERDALKTHNTMLRVCLKNIIKVADRNTDEFNAARAAIAGESK